MTRSFASLRMTVLLRITSLRDKRSNSFVIPANNHKGCAGPESSPSYWSVSREDWVPASAGTTKFVARISNSQ